VLAAAGDLGTICFMHAVVSTVRIEDVPAAREALAGLRLDVVPRAPGFVSAYWLEPVPPLPGVTPLKVEVREVYTSA
jgi:hypothetical protein